MIEQAMNQAGKQSTSSDLDGLIDRAQTNNERLYNLCDQLQVIVDRTFGNNCGVAEPKPDSAEIPMGKIGELRSALAQNKELLGRLTDLVTSMEKL